MPLHGLRISARGEGEMPTLGNKALNGELIPLWELPELIIESAVDIGDYEDPSEFILAHIFSLNFQVFR